MTEHIPVSVKDDFLARQTKADPIQALSELIWNSLDADRLRFLSGLEYILFNSDAKAVLKERSQLHKILAEKTWIFGEQYNLWVSDKSLTTVLRKHRDMLDPSVAIDEPVKIDGKKTGIVDLMFSTASRRHRSDDIENLVVELKAPAVKIGAKEIAQIEGYAFAINGDERFKGVAGVGIFPPKVVC